MPSFRDNQARKDYVKRTGKTAKVTKTVRVRPMRDVQKAQVMSLVKTAIARKMENKSVGNNVELGILHNSGIGSADCYPIIPQILPNTAGLSYQREGDRISPKSLSVKGLISWNSEAQLQKDIYVRILILSQKNIKVGSQVASLAVDTANLLKPNSPAIPLTSYAGFTEQVNYPVNKDLFRVYMDKTIKLTGNKSGTAVESIQRQSARWSYRFKSMPTAFTFDEGNGNWVNNFAPFIAVGYSYCDGTAPDTISTLLLSNTFSMLTFEDA